MLRRTVLMAAPLASTASLCAKSTAPNRLAVCVIGHTGRGNYGHGIDTVWLGLPKTRIVAVADADPDGLQKAIGRLGGVPGFANYREMLAKHRPDIVAICPRHPDQHRDMVLAACENGAKGIYIEKPFCLNLAEAGDIKEACEFHHTKLAVAHRNRYHPLIPSLHSLIANGLVGKPCEIRCRGKEDSRGGGEDLWVLGTHILNLARQFTGKFISCSATLLQDGKLATKSDCREGREALGTLAGNQLHARYMTESGIPVYFDSIKDNGQRSAGFGLTIVGNEGLVNLRCDKEPMAFFKKGIPWNPASEPKGWEAIGQNGPGSPPFPPQEIHDLHHHVTSCNDLLAAIEEDRLPLCNHLEAKETVEMVISTFESHRQGSKAISFPLDVRDNPLDHL